MINSRIVLRAFALWCIYMLTSYIFHSSALITDHAGTSLYFIRGAYVNGLLAVVFIPIILIGSGLDWRNEPKSSAVALIVSLPWILSRAVSFLFIKLKTAGVLTSEPVIPEAWNEVAVFMDYIYGPAYWITTLGITVGYMGFLYFKYLRPRQALVARV